jgi:hypothetical protein
MYLERPGQEKEEFIGYIESWLILRPTPRGGPGRNNDWIALLDFKNNNYPETTRDTAIALQSLYERDGTVQPTIGFKTLNEPRPDGTSIEADLGLLGTELVYISCFWIDSQVRSTLRDRSGSILTLNLLTYFLQLIVFWQ